MSMRGFESCSLVAVLVVAAAAGCGGDDDAGSPDAALADAASLPIDGSTGGGGGEQTFRLQRGYQGYDGVQDATLSLDEPDLAHDALGILEVAGQTRINLSPTGDLRAVLYFDVTPVATALGKDGCDVRVPSAELDLFVQGSKPATGPFVELRLLDPDGPLFDEATVTWSSASTGVPWGQDVVSDNVLDSEFATVGWTTFLIDGDIVEDWLCDPVHNRGMLLALSAENNSQWIQIPSSEPEVPDGVPGWRPALVLHAR